MPLILICKALQKSTLPQFSVLNLFHQYPAHGRSILSCAKALCERSSSFDAWCAEVRAGTAALQSAASDGMDSEVRKVVSKFVQVSRGYFDKSKQAMREQFKQNFPSEEHLLWGAFSSYIEKGEGVLLPMFLKMLRAETVGCKRSLRFVGPPSKDLQC